MTGIDVTEEQKYCLNYDEDYFWENLRQQLICLYKFIAKGRLS